MPQNPTPQKLLDHDEVRRLIALALDEDHVATDLTTEATGASGRPARARIVAKSDCVASGSALIPHLLGVAAEKGLGTVQTTVAFAEGAGLKKGDVWLTLEGSAGDILKLERTLLDFLMRSSGIATATREVVRAVEGTACKVLHTRKTAPGHRRPDVYAALVGGAHAHRLHLEDAILVKENHLRAAASFQSLFEGIDRLRDRARFVEIEVTDMLELKHALAGKPDRIMLDNFSVGDCAKAVSIFGSAVQLEASGGITLSNARAYAETGVDYISMGWMTHSAPAADLSLLFEV